MMIRNVTMAELTEHLAEHFDAVRQGTTLRVMEGDEMVATILPGQELSAGLTTYSIPGANRPKGSSGLVLAKAADRSIPLGAWRPEPLGYEFPVDLADEVIKDRERGR